MAAKKGTQAYKNKLEITRKYNARMTHFYLTFNPSVDGDVIEKINSNTNKNDYIRKLVRKDIQG